MHFYKVHGLCVASALPFPGLSETDEREADAIIRLHSGKLAVPTETIASGHNYRVTRAGTYIFDDRFVVLIREGHEIVVEPAAGVEPAELGAQARSLLGTLLHQRDRLVLHASAVAIGGSAVAFIGYPGCGKSSLALALYERGHDLLTDDVLSLDLSGATPMAIPGCALVSAWADTLANLSCDLAIEPHAPNAQRMLVIAERFADRPLPLRRLYTLVQGEKTAITPLAPLEALKELISHSRRADLPETQLARRHLDDCAQLVKTVSVRRFIVHRLSGTLFDLARLVEKDVAGAI
jgi:hypothetical protein